MHIVCAYFNPPSPDSRSIKVTGREPSIFFALLLVLSNAQFQKVTPEMTVFQTFPLQTVLESLLKRRTVARSSTHQALHINGDTVLRRALVQDCALVDLRMRCHMSGHGFLQNGVRFITWYKRVSTVVDSTLNQAHR
jgi:hypothetical protein